jgi:hypothetical protein
MPFEIVPLNRPPRGRREAAARPPPQQIPTTPCYPILSGMSRPRYAAPRLAASHCGGLPPRAGGAAGAAREHWPLARGTRMLQGCFQGCASEGPSIKWRLFHLSVQTDLPRRRAPAHGAGPLYHKTRCTGNRRLDIKCASERTDKRCGSGVTRPAHRIRVHRGKHAKGTRQFDWHHPRRLAGRGMLPGSYLVRVVWHRLG